MAYTIADYLVASGASASARGTYERQMKQLEGWLGKRLGDATAHDIERLKSKLRDMTSGPQYARLGRMFYKAADREDLRKLLVMKQRLHRLKPTDILSPKEGHAMIDNCASQRDGALRIVQRAAKRAGIAKRTYNHLFRHSRATNLLASGMSESQVRVLLGWKAGSPMLGRYSHLLSKDAYRGLLKSMGLVAEKEDMEQLSLEPETLRPIVPMIAPPGARSDAPVSQVELRELLDDPKVVRVMQILQELKGTR